MAFDEQLAERVRDELIPFGPDVREIKMFGGLCFTLRGNMVVGVIEDRLMIRFDKDSQDEVLALPHVDPGDFTGTVMRGFGFVRAEGTRSDPDLASWVKRCTDFVAPMPPKAPKKRKPPNPRRA